MDPEPPDIEPAVDESVPVDESVLDEPLPADESRRPRSLVDRVLSASLESWITLGVVVACVVFVVAQLQPQLVAANTTPNGGDMGAHVWAPAYLRDHLLPNWRLTGWTNDWYAGFPALRFYMVPPMLAVVLLDVVLPYGVAFKVATVASSAVLPIACWAFARLAGLRFPNPALFAVGALVFLFHRDYTIYGGNILSMLAGEFSFSFGLALAVLYLGLLANGLRTGRHRAWTAVVVALCGLTHVIPLIFAMVGTAVMFLVFPSRRGLRWLLTTAPVGALLAAWWLLPFWWQRAYLNDMGWEKTVPRTGLPWTERAGFWLTLILPKEQRWTAQIPFTEQDLRLDLVLVALAVVVVLFVSRELIGRWFVGMLVVGGIAVVHAPQGRLWNARLTPFTHLLVYLIVAMAVAEGIRRLAANAPRDWREPARVFGAVAACLIAFVLVALPLRNLPFGRTQSDGSYRWLVFTTDQRSFVTSWARWNYRGYERKPDWPEYEDVVLTMAGLGEEMGCGRAMWEYHRDLNRYGTPMALMLLPYWTDGCITSMEGLYFESAVTTPFHFMNQTALSTEPSSAQRGLPYRSFDIDLGVGQLQLLGVRYYMALTEPAIAAASRHADLTEVARSGPWVIYEVADAPLVEPVPNLPVVLRDPPTANHRWIEWTAHWFQDPNRWDVPIAADGPANWTRVDAVLAAPRVPVAPVEVTDVELTDDGISFDVSEPGVPVLVKVSYFPNWEASGADGPWRVSPTFMVVVPTETHVELTYGTAPVEVLGWALTLVGLVGLVWLARSGPLLEREPQFVDDETPTDA